MVGVYSLYAQREFYNIQMDYIRITRIYKQHTHTARNSFLIALQSLIFLI